MTRRWVRVSLTIIGAAVLLGGWVAFLARNGLDRADKWSSVAGALLAAAALWASLRASGGQVQHNSASGNATMYNVQGGDLRIGESKDPDEA